MNMTFGSKSTTACQMYADMSVRTSTISVELLRAAGYSRLANEHRIQLYWLESDNCDAKRRRFAEPSGGHMRIPTRIAAIAGLVALATAGIAHADTTVRVSGNTAAAENSPGWMFNRDSTAPFEFSLDAASAGLGSLHVLPISSTPASSKFVAELFLGTTVADTGIMSFDFKLGTGVATSRASQFYWNVYANFATSSPTKFYDCRFDLVANTGSNTSFSTVVFDPSLPVTNVAQRSTSPLTCPATLAGMGPAAIVRAAAINVGDSSAGDAGVSGYLDRVVVNVGGSATTYDFELPLQVKGQCKSGGWAAFGFANQGDCVSFLQASTHAGK